MSGDGLFVEEDEGPVYSFEGCEHIVEDLLDYAGRHRIPRELVDGEMQRSYWNHETLYKRIGRGRTTEDVLRHRLDVHVLEDHVRRELESIVSGKMADAHFVGGTSGQSCQPGHRG